MVPANAGLVFSQGGHWLELELWVSRHFEVPSPAVPEVSPCTYVTSLPPETAKPLPRSLLAAQPAWEEVA